MNRRMMLAAMFVLTAYAAPAVAQQMPKATLYRNQSCSCCLDYATYLRGKGFDVTVDSGQDLALVRKQLRVPEKFEACHVTVIGRYAVEGHVPVESINKLLADRPEIIGIAAPGMPSGTPGMTGRKSGPLSIYEIGSDPAPTKVFAYD